MSRLPQRPVAKATGLSALWVGRTEYYTADAHGAIRGGAWKTPPACDDPAKLIHWAVQAASQGAWKGEPLAFSLLLAPEVCEAFGIPATLPRTADTLWLEELTAAGWKVVTRGAYGPWSVIQGGPHRQIEIGICVTPWVPSGFRARATHGIAHTEDGRIDPFGTMYAHGQYRMLTGWNLSGGAGMAGIKALWRWPRKKSIYWAPPAAAWDDLTFLHFTHPEGPKERSNQRPWHLFWTTPDPAGAVPDPEMTHAIVWDQVTAYLSAWSAARLARGMLIHTGPGVQPNAKGVYPAGYYRVALTWSPELAAIVARLPPVYGSREELLDGSVWVTHEILDALAHLDEALPRLAPVASVAILDSWTCDDYGQLAKPWGEQVKKALAVARAEAQVAQDDAQDVVAQAMKATYAQGYPLVERGGIMRRPDHVDALIDHMAAFARFVRLVVAAYKWGVFPLGVSADEITMPCYADPFKLQPLSKTAEDGTYKIKTNRDESLRMATLADWETSLADGRGGRWWIEHHEPAPAIPRPRTARDAPNDTPDDDDGLFSYMMD